MGVERLKVLQIVFRCRISGVRFKSPIVTKFS